MCKAKTITTPWGSKQNVVDDLPMLTHEEEETLRQEWQTPPEFFAELNAEFEFQMDAAASRANALCTTFADKDVDALSVPWTGDGILRAYCNPGFSDMGPWIEKAAIEASRSASAVVAVLGLCSPSAAWWAMAVERASEIRLLAPRLQFVPPDPRIPKSSNSRENALFVFRGEHAHGLAARIWTWRWC